VDRTTPRSRGKTGLDVRLKPLGACVHPINGDAGTTGTADSSAETLDHRLEGASRTVIAHGVGYRNEFRPIERRRLKRQSAIVISSNLPMQSVLVLHTTWTPGPRSASESSRFIRSCRDVSRSYRPCEAVVFQHWRPAPTWLPCVTADIAVAFRRRRRPSRGWPCVPLRLSRPPRLSLSYQKSSMESSICAGSSSLPMRRARSAVTGRLPANPPSTSCHAVILRSPRRQQR